MANGCYYLHRSDAKEMLEEVAENTWTASYLFDRKPFPKNFHDDIKKTVILDGVFADGYSVDGETGARLADHEIDGSSVPVYIDADGNGYIPNFQITVYDYEGLHGSEGVILQIYYTGE